MHSFRYFVVLCVLSVLSLVSAGNNMEGDNQTLADLLKDNGYNAGSPEFIGKLPRVVKKRVCALKKVQQQIIEVEAKFYERVHELEKEFELDFNKLYEQRKKIVTGEYEPTDEESNLPIIHGIEEEDLKALNDKSEPDNGEKGVSEFWLNVLKGSDMTADMIQDHDEPILKHLVDITTSVELEPQGFTIYFHFSPNEYFKNLVLKKQYFLQMKPDLDDPFEFDGPSVIRAAGDEIQWEEGKNVTKKVVKKKQKKGANAGRFITKTVKADSFFNFFDTIKVDEHKNEDEEHDEDTTELMRADFEIGQVLRDNIIPRAVLYYTGEADVGDDMYDFDGEDGDDDVSDEEDEE